MFAMGLISGYLFYTQTGSRLNWKLSFPKFNKKETIVLLNTARCHHNRKCFISWNAYRLLSIYRDRLLRVSVVVGYLKVKKTDILKLLRLKFCYCTSKVFTQNKSELRNVCAFLNILMCVWYIILIRISSSKKNVAKSILITNLTGKIEKKSYNRDNNLKGFI